MVKQLLSLLVLLNALTLKAQTVDANYVQQHYTKTSYNIPMRDGAYTTLVYTENKVPHFTQPYLLQRLAPR